MPESAQSEAAAPSGREIDRRLQQLERRVHELEQTLADQEASDSSSHQPARTAQDDEPARCIRLHSQSRIFGIRWYDIAIGPDPANDEQRGHAKGMIAIGDYATGILAIGGLAQGVIAIGGLSWGLLTIGGCTLGLGAGLGGVAVGGFVLGGVAIGLNAQGGAVVSAWPLIERIMHSGGMN